MVSLPPNFEKVKKNTCVTQCSRTAHRRPERPQKTGQERFEKADARERERREKIQIAGHLNGNEMARVE